MATVASACHPATTSPADRDVSRPAPEPAQNTSDSLDTFRSAALKHFTPVAEEFELRTTSEKTLYPERYIEFRGSAGKLTVAYELESGPWVYVTVPTAGGHERQFGLHVIVAAQGISRDEFQKLTRLDGVDAQVGALAKLAHQHAGTLLKERTADLRALYLLSEKALRERERTETGFDRALEPRPTLQHLLGSCTSDLYAVCAYHATVDYDYSSDEIAAFLKVPKSDIQRMIAQHDTIQ
jgi:hypothetical protein